MGKPGIILAFCLCLNGFGGFCQENDIVSDAKVQMPLSWGIESDFNSKFLWRGINYNEGLVIQPNVWASYRNFTAGIWSNITAYDRHNSMKRNEIDLNLTYNYTLGKFEIDHMVLLYYYIGQEDSPPTGEFYTGISYPLGDFSLVSSLTADFLTYFGSLYFEHGIGYEKSLGKKFTIASSALLCWANGKFNQTYIGTPVTSLNLVTLNVEMTFKPGGSVYFKPHVQINRTLDNNKIDFIGTYPWFCGLLVGIEI